MGGMSAPAGLGFGQSWQDLTASRSGGVQYTNDTGKPIAVSVTIDDPSMIIGPIVGGEYVSNLSVTATAQTLSAFFIVPPGDTYLLYMNGGTIFSWAELR